MDLEGRIEEYLRAEEARDTFAKLRRAEAHRMSEQSEIAVEAAGNLLIKALDGMIKGDQARRDRFLDRAVSAAYDDREEHRPAVAAAMRMLGEIVDALVDDEDGLSIMIDVAARSPQRIQEALRSELIAVIQVSYDSFDEADIAEIEDAIDSLPDGPELWSFGADAADARELIIELLTVIVELGGSESPESETSKARER